MQIKLFIVLVFSLFFRISILYSQTWEKVFEHEFNGAIYSLQFDSYGNFYVASHDGLLCTTDRGVSWKNLYPTVGFSRYVSMILPIGKNELLISCTDGILYTNDGGLNWSGDSSYRGMDFLVIDKDENIYTGGKAIYRSTDKGKSWNKLKDSLYAWSFYITSKRNMLAGTNCGIFLSEDNGYNWTRTGYFNCGDVTYIKGTEDDAIIYIVGADRFRGIRYSIDGGYNWEYISNSDTIRWGSSIIPINNDEVYFGSHYHGVFKYNIRDSSLVDVNDGLQFGVSAMAYDSLGYLYVASNGIYKSKNTLDTNKYLRNSTYSYALSQNYPNPFNSNTTIEYSLETSGQVHISVYNLLGENVITILNEFKDKGNYHHVFNANNLASGIYFYKMKVGDFTQVKKMIVLR